MVEAVRRCVLLFVRTPREEARAKKLRSGRAVFAFSRARIARATAALNIDLVVVGALPSPTDGARARSLPQRGDGFGERLSNAFRDVRALGYEMIVAVPQDVPYIGRAVLERAFSELAKNDVVLGPSHDGGVYLIGARVPVEQLFEGVRWQTGFVMHDLAHRYVSAVLDPLFEIDTKEDLKQLKERPTTDPQIARLLLALGATPIGPPIERESSALLEASVSIRGPPAASTDITL
jgi:glycosyltransferase A (GT-A) superfamily protein (DUF2064 family)